MAEKNICKCTRPLAKIHIYEGEQIGYCETHGWQPCDPDNEKAKRAALERTKQEKQEKAWFCTLCNNNTRAEKIRPVSTGYIGRCPKHGWYATTPEAQPYATKENERERRNKKLTVCGIVFILLAAGAAALFWFRIRPADMYKEAVRLWETGNYTEAEIAFDELGSFRDSAQWKKASSLMLDLTEGNHENLLQAVTEYDDYAATGLDGKLSAFIADVLNNWKEKGLPPEDVLEIIKEIEKKENIATDIDLKTISQQAHAAMVDKDAVDSYFSDLNGDGEEEIVVLNPDGTIAVYRVVEDTNQKVSLDKEMMASCLAQFGKRLSGKDEALSLSCYENAYELTGTREYAEILTKAYQTQALTDETKGQSDMALDYALKAYQTSRTQDTFGFFWELAVRKATEDENKESGIEQINDLQDLYGQELRDYGLEEEAQEQLISLELAYADELASWKDAGCIEWLQKARTQGADIQEAVNNAAEKFDLGLTRVRLREMAASDENGVLSSQSPEGLLLKEEILLCLDDAQKYGNQPQVLRGLLQTAWGLDISKEERESVYEKVIPIIAEEENQIIQAIYLRDKDGYNGYCFLTDDAVLKVYRWDNDIQTVFSEDVPMKADRLTVIDKSLLLLDTEETAFAIYTLESGIPEYRYFAEGISDLVLEENKLSYGISLPGSIERTEQYMFDLSAPSMTAERTNVYWQEDHYPVPQSPRDAVIRYLEAVCYNLSDEQKILTAEEHPALIGYDDHNTAACPKPDSIDIIQAASYLEDEETSYFEVSFTSEGKRIVIYMAAVSEGDSWKTAGITDVFPSSEKITVEDHATELLCLNDEKEGQFEKRGDSKTYRILVPEKIKLQVLWQAGKKDGSSEAFQVGIYKAEDTNYDHALISYNLKPAVSRQVSNPLFLSPGVYYVYIGALRSVNDPYRITLLAAQEENTEAESNDTPQSANLIELGKSFTASLYSKDDVDYFRFRLKQAKGVKISLSAPETNGDRTRYILSLADAQAEILLGQTDLKGTETISTMPAVYLSEGEYLIQIKRGQTYSGGEYHILCEEMEEEFFEVEPNQSLETASGIQPGQETAGSFVVEGDLDIYSFHLEQDAIVRLEFTFPPTQTNIKTYVLTLMHNGTKLKSVNVKGKESGAQYPKWPLTAGDYYIKIENPDFIPQEYRLKVNIEPVSLAETEPNDELSQAMPLLANETVTGILDTEKDEDSYQLNVKAGETIHLHFKAEKITAGKRYYNVALYQNGKRLWQADKEKLEAGGFVETLHFEQEGIFYVVVKADSGNWTNGIYSIGVKTS